MSRVFKSAYISALQDKKIIETKPIVVEDDTIGSDLFGELLESDSIDAAPEEIKKLISNAKSEAKGLIENARLEIEAMQADFDIFRQSEEDRIAREGQEAHDLAYKQGHEEGYLAGYQVAEEAVKNDYAAKIVEINEVLRTANEQKKKELLDARDLIIKMALSIAEEIIFNNPEMLSSQIEDLVTISIEKIRDSKKIEILVNPNDYQRVNDALPKFKNMLQGRTEVIIQVEQHIGPGSCEIITEMGTIDAKTSTQFEEIKQALLSLDMGSDGIE